MNREDCRGVDTGHQTLVYESNEEESKEIGSKLMFCQTHRLLLLWKICAESVAVEKSKVLNSFIHLRKKLNALH